MGQNQCDFWIQYTKFVLDQLKKPRHQICCRPVIYIYINENPKHVDVMWSYIKKVDLIEQNPCDFWIQHIKIVLDQLKKPRHQICCSPVIYIYINEKTRKSHLHLLQH